MNIDENTIKKVESYLPRMRQWLRPFDSEIEDVTQDVYVKLLEAPEGTDTHLIIYGACSDYRRKELNRRKLEADHSDEIVRNTTPTLSGSATGGPEEFAASEQELVGRWNSMSPMLQRVARRTFFGYTECPEKTARELGMTVAAVNMARTRIKQHMNGVNNG